MAPFVVKGSLTCQFVVVACRAVGCCGRGKRKRGQVNVRHCHCCQAGQRPTSAWAPAVPLGCRDCARAGRGERSARLFHRAATRNSYDNSYFCFYYLCVRHVLSRVYIVSGCASRILAKTIDSRRPREHHLPTAITIRFAHSVSQCPKGGHRVQISRTCAYHRWQPRMSGNAQGQKKPQARSTSLEATAFVVFNLLAIVAPPPSTASAAGATATACVTPVLPRLEPALLAVFTALLPRLRITPTVLATV